MASESADRIRFLVDENVPEAITELLRSRGHVVESVGEAFAKSSPDSLLLTAAEQWGFVVVTFDKDFKRLIQQVPLGRKGKFSSRAGRLSLSCDEPEAIGRISEMISLIEVIYTHSTRDGKRFIMQISKTSYTVSG